jgi:hypothetical protein
MAKKKLSSYFLCTLLYTFKNMGNLNTIVKKTWNRQKFTDKQRPLRKYRYFVNIKNRIILYWLSLKDIFNCL